MIINEFKGKYFFLSNYYSHKFTYNDTTFLNSEAAFQAQKCPKMANLFSNLTPNRAKALGRRVKLRDDWENVKDDIMKDILRTKFSDDKLKAKLLETYPAILIEGNMWGDKYWGVDLETSVGKNKLGKILTDIREELYNEV